MKRNLLLVFFVFCSIGLFAQQPLPRYMTEEEKAIYPMYLESIIGSRDANPPSVPPRTPGEWDENQAVVIAWTSYTPELREIVRYAREYVTVYIVCDDSTYVKNNLTNGGVPLQNIKYIIGDYNSVWIRDYGPQSVYLQGTNELAIVDWVYNRPRPADDQVPVLVANKLGVPIYQMTVNPNKLVATGGNLMMDGHGRAFSSKLIVEENSNLTEAQINTIVNNYMGIGSYIKLNTLPYDGIHHIDMHMKLLDEETLLVGQYPAGVADGPQIEANLQYILDNFQTPYGRPYKVVRIPMPSSPSGNYPPNSNYYTYTNSVILNGLVLVPVYGFAQDEEALEVYRNAMPGYKVIGLDMYDVIPASGAIHCITHEIAANDPIFISHKKILEGESSETSFPVKAFIETTSGVQSAKLFWSIDTIAGFNEASMTLVNDTFVANIPGQACGEKVFYYISVTNNNNKTLARPIVGPKGPYSFEVIGDEADFTSNVNEAMVGETVIFKDVSCLTYSTYAWNFGEGANPATASGPGPHEVTYSSVGAKTISLSLDGGQPIVKEDYVQINEAVYVLTVSKEGNGETNPVPGEYNYNTGTEVELTATPSSGWKLSKWEVNGSVYTTTESTISLTMNENMIAKAIFTENVGIDDNTSAQVNIFPNPTGGMLTVNMNQAKGDYMLSISNIQGQEVYQSMIPEGQGSVIIDLSAQPAGVYFIRLIGQGNVFLNEIIRK